jgi:hypothetical protein
MKHTPGPWEVGGAFSNKTYVVAGEGCIARCDDGEEGYDHLANARLIAAAPDLLEALKALLVMCHSPEPVKLDEALTWRENDERAEAMARAAIAKATADY